MNTATAPHDVSAHQHSPIEIIRQKLDTDFVTRGRVVVIGIGGIGLYLVRPLTTFLAALVHALGADELIRLILCDGDAFAPENTYRVDVPQFGNKAEIVGQDLLERSHAAGLIIRWVPEYVTKNNVAELIQEGDCVLLAVDNHATRKLVSRWCSGDELKNVVLLSGGNDGIEDGLSGTYANVQVYVKKNGCDLTAPLDRFHPEIANPTDQLPSDLSCLERAAAGVPQLSFTNLAVASAMCNALLRVMMARDDEPLYDEVALDIYEAVTTPHSLTTSSKGYHGPSASS